MWFSAIKWCVKHALGFGADATNVGELWEARQTHKRDLALAKLKIESGEALTAQEVQLIRTRNMQGSWKDEFWCIVLALPWIAMFFSVWWPSLSQAANDMIGLVGVEHYNKYLAGAIAASFGLRMWGRRRG